MGISEYLPPEKLREFWNLTSTLQKYKPEVGQIYFPKAVIIFFLPLIIAGFFCWVFKRADVGIEVNIIASLIIYIFTASILWVIL